MYSSSPNMVTYMFRHDPKKHIAKIVYIFKIELNP